MYTASFDGRVYIRLAECQQIEKEKYISKRACTLSGIEYSIIAMKNKSLPVRLKSLLDSNPLAAMFVVDALLKQVDAVLKDEDATRQALKNSLITGQAWIDAAKACQKIINI
jgi:hypothetical protein